MMGPGQPPQGGGYGPPWPQGQHPQPGYGPAPKKKRGCLLPLLGVFGALLGIALIVSKCDSSLKQPPAAAAQTDTPPPGSASSAPTAASVTAADDAGTEKRSAQFLVTLKDATLRGKLATVTFLLKNDRDKESAVSSLMMFQATTEDGDRGTLDPGEGSCDGAAPPHGVFKCKLVYAFDKPVKELTVRVGATLRSDDAVFFRIKASAK